MSSLSSPSTRQTPSHGGGPTCITTADAATAAVVVPIPQRTATTTTMASPHREPTTVLEAGNPVSIAWKHVSYKVLVPSEDAGDEGGGGDGACRSDIAETPQPKPKKDETGEKGKKKWKVLLHDMSGIARSGRVLAIMGPSGAGKTTLMNALAGRLTVDDRTHILEGSCELNGVPFSIEYKPLLTVVAQDDIVMGKETPRDALKFSAQMRLGVDSDTATAMVNDMLTVLRLEKCADTFIGIPGAIKGISGGEKKRVNIGCELITNPSIVIMDEPTTGLDSVNATRIGMLMRDLTLTHGRTVICTVHTPSSALFEMFDDLLLLGKGGHVVYHGPREGAVEYFSDVLGHPVPPQMNPIEHYMDTLQTEDKSELKQMGTLWRSQLLQRHRKGKGGRGGGGGDAKEGEEEGFNRCVMHYPKPKQNEALLLTEGCKSRGTTSFFDQFRLLLARAFRMYRRDPATTFGRGVLTIYVAILVGLFFFGVERDYTGVNNVSGVIFLICLNQLLFSMMPGVVMFPAERAIFLNEQSASMYHPAIYTIARIIAEVPANIFFPTLYSCILYFMVDLRHEDGPGHFFAFLLIVVQVGMVGFSLGMFASSIFPRLEIAMAFLPVCVMPLTIVAGLFANTARLDPYWLWLTYISFPRYGYAALVVNEFKGRPLCFEADNSTETNSNSSSPATTTIINIAATTTPIPTYPQQVQRSHCLYQVGDDYLRVIGFDDWEWWMSVWILFLFILFFWGCAIVALTVQGVRRRGTLAFKAKVAADPDVEDLGQEVGPSRESQQSTL